MAPCGVLLPGPVQYCSQHSCIIAVELLLQLFSQRPSSASIQQYQHDRSLRFILSVRFDFHMIESLSIADHAFVSRVSMSFSVDEMYIFTNLISTSIHGTRKKEKKNRQEQEIRVSRITARGKKKKYYRSKRKKRPTSSDPLKKIKGYAVSWSKEN